MNSEELTRDLTTNSEGAIYLDFLKDVVHVKAMVNSIDKYEEVSWTLPQKLETLSYPNLISILEGEEI